MRHAGNKDHFTPFGIWIQEYLKSSSAGLAVTTLDYVLEDFKARRLMLLEEKQNGGIVHQAQRLTFALLDRTLRLAAPEVGYDYWGCYVLRFAVGAAMPGPGMTLKDRLVTAEQLQAHLNFEQRFCAPWDFRVGSNGL
jgi:hypothetical protein